MLPLMPETVQTLASELVDKLTEIIEAAVEERVRSIVLGAIEGGGPVGGRRGRGGQGRPRRAASGRASAGRQLQGKYLGALRALKGADRTRVQAVAREKSVAEALKLANQIRGK